MRLWKKLLAVIATASLLLGLAAPAFAAYPDGVQAAAERMHTLGLIQGKGGPDLALGDNLTRAEAVTIIVRAFGKADDAKLLKGAPAYPDTANHWASGEIALAKNIIEANGQSMGMPDGTFAPNGQLTVAQTVAFLLKFLGVKFTSDANWINNAFQAAVDAGVMSADDAAALKPQANTNATRGTAFYLADNAFAGYKLPAGKTVYQIYQVPNPPALNVAKVDATTTESSITFTGTVDLGASLWVNSPANAITPAADGSFSYSADLSMGDNTFTFGAADLVGNVTTSKVTVTRTVGAVATVDASDITVTAGGSVAFAPVVKDAKGNEISGADVTVTSDLGTYADGQFTAGTKAGTGTATVKVGDISKDVNVTVNAGDLATLTVTPATVDIAAGGSQKFAVAGVDANGNAVATPSVTWSASKGVIGPDGTFGATTDAAGTVTVTATAGSVSGTASVNVFSAAAKVVLAAPAAIVANGVSTGTLSATVVDANGNTVKNYTGNVTFASSNTASLSVDTATVAAVGGVATTTTTAGTSTSTTVVSASASGLQGTTQTLAPTAQVATSVAISAKTTTLAAATGSQTTLTLKYKDQTGNDLLSGNLPASSSQPTIRLTSGDGSIANFGSTTTTTADIAMNAVSKTSTLYAGSGVGATTITGSNITTGSAITVNSVSVNTQITGPAYKLSMDAIANEVAGDATNLVTVTYRVLDWSGNQLTGDLGTITGGTFAVTVTDSDGANAVTANEVNSLTSTGNTTRGVGTATFIGLTAGTYTVKVNHSTYGSATNTVSITPAAASKLVLSASPSTIAADGVSQSTVTVKVKDQYNNLVTDGSYTVTLSKSGSFTSPLAATTLTTSNGVATFTVTSTTARGTDTYTVAAQTGVNLTGDSKTVSTDIFGAPYKVAFATSATDKTAPGAAGYTGTVGVDAPVYVAVEDALNTLLTTDNGRAVSLAVKDADGVVVGTFTGTTVNGVATVNVNLTTATRAYTADGNNAPYSLEATSGTLVKDNTTNTTNAKLSLNPSSATQIALSVDRSQLAADGASTATVKIKLKDQYGNTTTAPSGGATVTLAITSGSSATLEGTGATEQFSFSGTTTSQVTSDGTSSVKATGGEGTVTVTGSTTAAGISSGSVNVSTKITGPVAALTMDSIASAQVSATPATWGDNYQTVVVRLVDGAGQPVTGGVKPTNSTNHDGTQGFAPVVLSATGIHGAMAVFDASGTALSAPYTVDAVKGVATFLVQDDKTDSLTFTATALSKTQTATGAFTPGTATKVVVQASTPAYINADGVAMTTVNAWVEDALNNKVTTASGTMTFSIKTGADYATLLSTSAPINSGVATIVAQSKLVPGSTQAVTIHAESDVNGDGSVAGQEISEVAAFTVVGVTPSTGGWNTIGTDAQPTVSLSSQVGAALAGGGNVPIASVKFQYSVKSSGVWNDLNTLTSANAGTNNYEVVWGSTRLTVGTQYSFRAVVTDTAGRVLTTDPVDASAAVATNPGATTATGVALANANGTVATGDTIVITFDHAIQASTLASGLANGTTVVPSGNKVVFNGTDHSIKFFNGDTQIDGLGSFAFTVGDGSMTAGVNHYAIASYALNAGGTQLTITLGAEDTGDAAVTMNLGTTGAYTYTSSAAVLNTYGTAVTSGTPSVTGNF